MPHVKVLSHMYFREKLVVTTGRENQESSWAKNMFLAVIGINAL